MPVKVTMPAGVTFTQIAASEVGGVALTSEGIAYSWGTGKSGGLGNGTVADSRKPVPVTMPAGVTFTQVTGGFGGFGAIGDDGKLYAWGSDSDGVATGGHSTTDASGNVVNILVPTELDLGTDAEVTAVYGGPKGSGGEHMAATTADGVTYTWGIGSKGQLGSGEADKSTVVPRAVDSTLCGDFSFVAVSEFQTTAVGCGGQLYTWGDYNDGTALGDAAGTITSSVPVAVVMPIRTISGVTFDGLPGTGLTQAADGTWTVVTPAHDAGAVDVVVSTTATNGTDPLTNLYADSFTYIGEVTPAEPTQSGATVTIPTTVGVDYKVDGEIVTGEIVLDDQESITVTAVPQSAYVLADGATASWDFTFALPRVTPTDPTQVGDTVTIPTTVGVDYQIDGKTVTGDQVLADQQSITVTAVAQTGYVIADGAQTEWNFSFALPRVTPGVPTQVDDKVTIPTTTGVDYKVDGEIVTGEITLDDLESITVTAVAQTGYVIADGAETSWNFTFALPRVTPTEPTQVGDTVTVPTTVGVDYQVNGVTVTGDQVLADQQSITVTAVAQTGYVIKDDATVSWDFTFALPRVTPDVPTQVDDKVTIPTTTGVDYKVDGQTVTGEITLADQQNITVTAVAQAGYVITDGATATWSFSFELPRVTAAAPTQSGDTVTIPATEGVDYQIDGKTVTGDQVLTDGQSVTVTAVAQTGYVIADGAQTEWTFSFALPRVTPAIPTQDGDTVTIPVTEGVDYQVNGETITGTANARAARAAAGAREVVLADGESITVTAVAQTGYVIADGAATEWTFSFALPRVTPDEPTQSGDTVTIPTTEDVDYQVDGKTVTGELTVADGQTVKITAVAQAGYVLSDGAEDEWSYANAADIVEPGASASTDGTAADEAAQGAETDTGGEAAGGLLGLGAILTLVGAGATALVRRKRH